MEVTSMWFAKGHSENLWPWQVRGSHDVCLQIPVLIKLLHNLEVFSDENVKGTELLGCKKKTRDVVANKYGGITLKSLQMRFVIHYKLPFRTWVLHAAGQNPRDVVGVKNTVRKQMDHFRRIPRHKAIPLRPLPDKCVFPREKADVSKPSKWDQAWWFPLFLTF